MKHFKTSTNSWNKRNISSPRPEHCKMSTACFQSHPSTEAARGFLLHNLLMEVVSLLFPSTLGNTKHQSSCIGHLLRAQSSILVCLLCWNPKCTWKSSNLFMRGSSENIYQHWTVGSRYSGIYPLGVVLK